MCEGKGEERAGKRKKGRELGEEEIRREDEGDEGEKKEIRG